MELNAVLVVLTGAIYLKGEVSHATSFSTTETNLSECESGNWIQTSHIIHLILTAQA